MKKLLFWGALIGAGVLIYKATKNEVEAPAGEHIYTRQASPWISGVIVPYLGDNNGSHEPATWVGQSNWPQNI
jgi:hypothetical protein